MSAEINLLNIKILFLHLLSFVIKYAWKQILILTNSVDNNSISYHLKCLYLLSIIIIMHILKTKVQMNKSVSVEVPTGEEIDMLTNVAHRFNTSGGESSCYLTFQTLSVLSRHR